MLINLVSYSDNMTEADVGVKPNMPFFKTREAEGLPKITYLHLHECEKFSVLKKDYIYIHQ